MKVSCQSCGAQYNLPDDKVRGRKAKVRCKKCSAQIIVDGTSFADEEDDEATRVMLSPALSASGEPVWTVNLSDEEQLDMTEPELLAGWRDGRVTEDAYVWREGMDEWLPIMESTLAPTLRGLAAKAADVEVPTPIAAPVAREVASSPKQASSPFAAPAPKVASTPLASPAPTPAASPAPPVVAAAPASLDGPSVPGPKPKATRSDDTSKAFSFALGSGSGATKKASRPPGAAAAAVGGLFGSPTPAPAPVASSSSAASSENSVMFSLDALKAAAAAEPKRSSVRAAAVSDARVNEDILTLGTPNRFDDHAMPLIDIEVPPPAPRVDSPVAAAPLAAPQKKKSSWGLIVGGLVAVAGMGGAYVLGQQGKEPPPVVAQNDNTDAVSGTRQGTPDPANAASATGEQPAASASATAPAVASNAQPASSQAGGSKPVGGGSGIKTGGDKTPEKPVDTGKTDKPAPSPAPAPAPKPGGPPFNVAAAKSALATAAAGAAGCRAPAGPNGTGKVQVTFAPSGNVTSALIVSGPFGGTPVGSCVARTFRAAKVPAFDGSPMTVSKSFTIN